jgi:L-arabonate dehydrase
MKMITSPVTLRSDSWFGPEIASDVRAHHTGKLSNSKFTPEELTGTDHHLASRTTSGRRPVIGVVYFGGDLNPCQAMHDDKLGQRVKDGIRGSGGIPFEVHAAPPLGEPLSRPTAALYRNLTAMTLLETIIANPLDGLVLLTGCDKTVPAGLMAALMADLPVLVASGGPMLNGYYRGQLTASGGHLWANREKLAAGEITEADLMERSYAAQPSAGHCMSMGTASTMNALAEALGMTLLGSSSIPSAYAGRGHISFEAGQEIVSMVLNDRRPSNFLTRQSFLNAIAVNTAIGGSTNAVIHLLAMAKAAEIQLDLEDWHSFGRHVPLLVNVKPSGQYLMEEYHRAGGLPRVMQELVDGGFVDGQVGWCNRESLSEALAEVSKAYVDREVIYSFQQPLLANAGIVVLRGNLAPDGAVVKVSAVSAPAMLQHRGQAVVFDSIEEYQSKIDDPSLDIKPENVLVLRNCGPIGYPGMPEVGNVRLPGYLLKAGVKVMLTVSDARMSGTAYGLHVLHVSPEAAVGGPLALVQNGDWIELDTANRTITLDVGEAELEERRQKWVPPVMGHHTPWTKIHRDEKLGVNQANKGAYLQVLDDPDLSRTEIASLVRFKLRRQH